MRLRPGAGQIETAEPLACTCAVGWQDMYSQRTREFRHDTHLNVWGLVKQFCDNEGLFLFDEIRTLGYVFSVTTLSSNYEKRYFTRIEIIKFSFCSYEAILSRSKRNGEFYGDFVSHFFRFCSSKLSLKFHIFCASITLFIHMSVLQIY